MKRPNAPKNFTMLRKVEGQPAARYMDSITVARGTLLKYLKDQIQNRSSWGKNLCGC